MYTLYNLILFACAPFLALYWGFQAIFRGKIRQGLADRMGFPHISSNPNNIPTLWIHTVSIGEAHAAAPLVQELKNRLPSWRLVLSTITETGREAGNRRIPQADERLYFPLDFPGAVHRSIQRVQPQLTVILETELWPNFIRAHDQLMIPSALINGRISPKSFNRYRRIRPLMIRVLERMAVFGMQSESDAERIRALGAPPNRVRVGGNLKFDGAANSDPPKPQVKLDVRRDLGLSAKAPILVAGSIHPEEGGAILDGYEQLLSSYPTLQLILAPRHPNRVDRLLGDLRNRNIEFHLRTDSRQKTLGHSEKPRVLVLNTLGELSKAYCASNVAFVGGSLFPWGGQNPLEPAGFGIPVLFGRHMHNFEEAERALSEPNTSRIPAALRISGPLEDAGKQLAAATSHILDSPARATEMGVQGRTVVETQAGAARRYAEWVTELAEGQKA